MEIPPAIGVPFLPQIVTKLTQKETKGRTIHGIYVNDYRAALLLLNQYIYGKKKVQFTVYNYGFYSDILYYIAFAAVTAFPGSGQTVDGTSLTVVLVAFFALLSFSFNHVLAHRAYLVRKTGT